MSLCHAMISRLVKDGAPVRPPQDHKVIAPVDPPSRKGDPSDKADAAGGDG